MRFLIVSIALFLPLTSAYTYWIDPVSCTSDKLRPAPQFGDGDSPDTQDRWASLISEVKDLGSSALQRLDRQAENEDFRRAWNWLFDIPGSGQDRKQPISLIGPVVNVKTYLEFLQGLGMAVSQVQANIRIYCDNDARWVQKQGGKGWKDTSNRMSSQHVWCREGGDILGVTYTDADEVKDHSLPRSTITLCDALFNKANDAGKWQLSDIGSGRDFSADVDSINWIRFTVTSIILHELSHCPPIKTDDPLGQNSYGWGNSVNMVHSNKVKNADSYMYIALMSFFADRKYGLNRDEIGLAGLGELVKYNDIPPRELNTASRSQEPPPTMARSFVSRINRWMFR